MNNLIKRERATKYLDTFRENSYLSASDISDVMKLALKDDIKELIVTQSEYEVFIHHAAVTGLWNWDMKTVFGITLVIR